MGGPPAYLAAETAPQPPATIVKVPTASAAHLAAKEYFGLSSAMVCLFVRRVDGVDADGMSLQVVLCGLAAVLGFRAVTDCRGWIVGVIQLPQTRQKAHETRVNPDSGPWALFLVCYVHASTRF